MLKTALMFQDHMILQREKPVRIWGEADPGETIVISIQGQECSCTAGEDGRWSAVLAPLTASFGETLTVTGAGETLTFKDVQVGDVWLAAGQSNMEFFMRYDADLEEEKKVCTDDSLRFFDYPEVAYPGQIDEADYGAHFGFWRKACPEDLQWFSAVGYYFAKDIRKEYDIPVGILGCNWGGTPACAWMSEEAVLEGGRAWLDDYREGLKTLDLAKYDEQFKMNPTAWRTNPFEDPFTDLLMQGASILDIIRKLTGREPDLSALDMAAQAPAVGPKSETRPCGLYESMLTETAPYTLKGILFYQGESDGDRHPDVYATLFPALIRCFRDLWQEELPFLFVQLAPFGSWLMSVGEPYEAVRAAQQLAADTVPGTGMAVITDVGMELDIHPKKKQPVGHRLALQARAKVYGEDILCEAPTLTKMTAADGSLTLSFENAGEGLYLADHTPDGAETDTSKLGGLKLFLDGELLPENELTAEACGSTVTIRSDKIRENSPVRAELACGGWYRVNLYNSAGIPARPAKASVN